MYARRTGARATNSSHSIYLCLQIDILIDSIEFKRITQFDRPDWKVSVTPVRKLLGIMYGAFALCEEI